MAELYGVKLTSLKTYMGMEGPASQGNVRLNGKLLGFWSQDGNGGCDRYEFDVVPLREPAKKLFDSKPQDWEYRDLYEKQDGSMHDSFLDAFMYELLCLTDDEKDWKKMAKRGYPVMAVYHFKLDPKFPNAIPVTKKIFLNQYFVDKSDDDVKTYMIKEHAGDGDIVFEKIVRSAADFIVK